jgi:hypothetical protein
MARPRDGTSRLCTQCLCGGHSMADVVPEQYHEKAFEGLRMHIMSNAIGLASSHHKQATTDQKVNEGLQPQSVLCFREIEQWTVTTI